MTDFSKRVRSWAKIRSSMAFLSWLSFIVRRIPLSMPPESIPNFSFIEIFLSICNISWDTSEVDLELSSVSKAKFSDNDSL